GAGENRRIQCRNCNCLLTLDKRFSQSPLCASGSASVPQSFFTISRCGTNGHFAFGFLNASSISRNASCAPVITDEFPNCEFNLCVASSSAPQRSASVRPHNVGCVSG